MRYTSRSVCEFCGFEFVHACTFTLSRMCAHAVWHCNTGVDQHFTLPCAKSSPETESTLSVWLYVSVWLNSPVADPKLGWWKVGVGGQKTWNLDGSLAVFRMNALRSTPKPNSFYSQYRIPLNDFYPPPPTIAKFDTKKSSIRTQDSHRRGLFCERPIKYLSLQKCQDCQLCVWQKTSYTNSPGMPRLSIIQVTCCVSTHTHQQCPPQHFGIILLYEVSR